MDRGCTDAVARRLRWSWGEVTSRPIDNVNATPPTRPSNDALVARHTELVTRAAGRMRRRIPSWARLEYCDLVSAGFVGLLEAADRFDWSEPDGFASYAEFRVRGAILDELRALDPVPRAARRLHRAAEQARHQLRQQQDRDPSRSEVARAIDRSTRNVAVVEQLCACGLDQELPEALPSAAPTPLELALDSHDLRAASEAIAALPDRHRDVIRWHYVEDVPFTEIATRLGVTRGRVSQLKSDALRRLRASMPLSASMPLQGALAAA